MTPHEATEQGFALHKAGRLTEAEALYAAALAAEAEFYPALHLMGLLRFQQGNFAAALDVMSRALAVAPQNSQVQLLAQRGEALLQLERMDEAVADFDKALAGDPNQVAAWNNRGLALNALKRFDQALDSFDRAIELSPQSVEVHNNRGDTLREMRRFDEALKSFSEALRLKPDDWASLTNRAVALSVMGRIDEAIADYDRSLALAPNTPAALHARGNLNWTHKAKLAPAMGDLERLVTIAPDYPFARGSLMRLKMTAARWDDFAEQKKILDDGVKTDKSVVEPFIYLALSDRPLELQRCARLYAKTRFPPQRPLCKKGARRSKDKIRVGYVCGEFRAHATLYLMAGLFEAHDKKAFEILAFDNGGSDGSPLRARFEAAVPNIIDIRQMSDAEAAARIHGLGIDILLDLNGYSGSQRLGIFAHRPAPLQVSYLAYPGTLGAPYMDYILADAVVIPQGDGKYFDEKIVRLPHSYQINDRDRPIAEPPTRGQAGLPEKAFVFCNFNHANKFTPSTFTLWMKVLAQAPGSILWLLTPDPIAQNNLRREAEKRSVDPGRLVFAPALPFEQHLARLKLADLFLDGLPYGAHTTASDALWAGLPVLTCRGTAFAGRVAASLLTAVGLPELITTSYADFEKLALRLAREPAVLKKVQGKLAKNWAHAPLFDTKATTKAIETAYRMMLEQGAPKSFAVPEK